MLRKVFTLLCLFGFLSTSAQNDERCGSTIQAHQNMMENNPEYKKHIENWRKAIEPIIAKRRLEKNPDCSAGPILVPVAVHFDSGLVPGSQEACVIDVVVDQINEVNAEFAGMDIDAPLINNFTACFGANILGDACLEFCLATENHPSGSGLVEGEYAVTFGTVSFSIPGGNWTPVNPAWSDYVNIYVDNLPGGLLGVSNGIPGQFNGDGVMVDNCVFGTGNLSCSGVQLTGSGGCFSTYDEGETLAHELGHYFGLYHIWGDNSNCNGNQDNIADTPNMSSNYSGYLSCTNDNSCSDLPQTCGSEDMYMNFMSYAGDGCMYMFTSDQMDVCNATAVTEGFTTSSSKCSAPVPVADFSPSGPVSLCGNLCIDFLDESSNSPDTWDWVFTPGPGNLVLDITSSTDQNPTVCILSGTVGSISTMLTAGNSGGDHDTTKVLNVTINPPQTWYRDFDGDSYGDPMVTIASCTIPTGYVFNNTDCDDMDANNFPTNTEICDNQDNNCDGLIDDDDPNVVAPTWYRDFDNDTFGDESVFVTQCIQPLGYVADNTDCDDMDANNFPGNTEVCDFADNDCDGLIDDEDGDLVGITYYEDLDGDTFGNPNAFISACDPPGGYVEDDSDCDDNDNTVYPDAPELCDGIINNCNTGSLPANEVDDDNDGYVECTIDAGGWDGVGSVVGGDDCDDAEATKYPGAPELCDGIINDCNSGSLAGNEVDDDGDGYVECTIDPGGWDGVGSVVGGDDCDDAEATKYPGAPELCDGIINDCNSGSLAGNEVDDDADGYVECTIDPGGWDGVGSVVGGDDCDDAEATKYPGAPELCDGIINDCNSGSLAGNEVDDDADGYVECTIDPGGWDGIGSVVGGDDCDDAEATKYPGAPELCDGIINDCNSGSLSTDEIDNDGDGYVECTIDPGGWDGAGSVVGGDDCDDAEANNYPGNTEICDGIDNNCDSVTDEGCMLVPCDDDSLFISTIAQSEYHALDYIWSDATIINTEDILYTAGIDIDLVEEFEVELGAEFEARIESCSILFRIEGETDNNATLLSTQLIQMSKRFYTSEKDELGFKIVDSRNGENESLKIKKDEFGQSILDYLIKKESGIYYIQIDGEEENKMIEKLIWIK